jgi:hypothetical protein
MKIDPSTLKKLFHKLIELFSHDQRHIAGVEICNMSPRTFILLTEKVAGHLNFQPDTSRQVD